MPSIDESDGHAAAVSTAMEYMDQPWDPFSLEEDTLFMTPRHPTQKSVYPLGINIHFSNIPRVTGLNTVQWPFP